MSAFVLSCESTVDLPWTYARERGISVLHYSYTAGGQSFPDDMGEDPQSLSRFYGFLAAGEFPSTSQLNEFQYEDYFRGLLETGDVLHIAFGSGMTPSVNNALRAAKRLREEFPQRKLAVVDSLCSSSGYGLLVDSCADLRDRGASLEETEAWALDNRMRVHHQFFSTDLKYFRRSGRVSGAAATVGAILDICPIMRLDDTGSIKAYSKVRGKKKAVEVTVDTMEQCAEGGRDYDGKCFVCHSQCPEDARMVMDAIEARFPRLRGKIRLCDIGTIIGSHAGPGTVAVFFYGSERPRMD